MCLEIKNVMDSANLIFDFSTNILSSRLAKLVSNIINEKI